MSEDKKSKFVTIKLSRELVENMVSTYEFFAWNNIGKEKRECQRILKAINKALVIK